MISGQAFDAPHAEWEDRWGGTGVSIGATNIRTGRDRGDHPFGDPRLLGASATSFSPQPGNGWDSADPKILLRLSPRWNGLLNVFLAA